MFVFLFGAIAITDLDLAGFHQTVVEKREFGSIFLRRWMEKNDMDGDVPRSSGGCGTVLIY